ncbi:DUF5811 family protein [Halomarina ordinaria]|uniref:DUF5811 family protein n=1 Tax=Halomarina ordinaria TaxID=3033939 RepID=A0ABD5UI55_9EURY|nr:DUF5811 family protein [Halomarina sp. PSRA2]
MHGNTPYAGRSTDADVDLTPEQVATFRTDLTAMTAYARTLLPDEFVVGSELRDGSDGPEATLAVQPPVGHVVSAGVTADATEEERAALVHELAAGAAVQVKQAVDDVTPTAG